MSRMTVSFLSFRKKTENKKQKPEFLFYFVLPENHYGFVKSVTVITFNHPQVHLF